MRTGRVLPGTTWHLVPVADQFAAASLCGEKHARGLWEIASDERPLAEAVDCAACLALRQVHDAAVAARRAPRTHDRAPRRLRLQGVAVRGSDPKDGGARAVVFGRLIDGGRR